MMKTVPVTDLRDVDEKPTLMTAGEMVREDLEDLWLGGHLEFERYTELREHVVSGGRVVRASCGHVVRAENESAGACKDCYVESEG